MLTRREFASGAIAAALSTKADASPPGADGEWRNRQEGMSYRRLGRTGYQISEVVMGGNTIAPENWEHVLLALDQGLNYLDTAPAYGNTKSELGYAKVLKARKRDSFFLNTKISLWDVNRSKLYRDIFASLPASEQTKLENAATAELERRRALDPDYFCNYFASQERELRDAALADVLSRRYGSQIDRDKNYRRLILQSVDESLARLGTDYVDLLMCPHGASTPSELLSHPEIFDAFESLKKQGKVRHLGVSAHSDTGAILDAAVQAKVYSAAMIAYNIVNRRYVDGALERARKADFGVIAMKVARPVYHGRNNGQPDNPQRQAMIHSAVPGPLKVPQKAYAWALRNKNLSGVISEMVTASHVEENLPLGAPKPALA